jgi:periplasmic protein TonB
VLNRLAYVYSLRSYRYTNYNVVEFMFYPDGHIGPIKILKDTGFEFLDKITKETIDIAYKDYPRPSEPTLIKYSFFYDL